MEKLPVEITLDIFYRIPAETLVQCKFVCKSWHKIIVYGDGGGDANYFANMHLRRLRHKQNSLEHSTLTFIFMHHRSRGRGGQKVKEVEIHVTEYNDDDNQLTCKKINFPAANYNFIRRGWTMGKKRKVAGSCNGLICLTRRYGITFLEDAIAICNPLLKEYVTLPLSDTHFQSGSMTRRDIRLGHRTNSPLVLLDQYKVTTGFGYHPGTGEYKVVRVDYGHYYHNRQIGDVEVYTLGDKSINGRGMWRSKGTIDYWLVGQGRLPVLMNGSLHWFAWKRALRGKKLHEDKKIVSFDLGVEEFHMFPTPPLPSVDPTFFKMDLLELRQGCLCFTRTGAYEMDIWVLKDYMNKESWVQEFSIKWEEKPWCYSPCAIKKKKKKNGTDDVDHDEILLWCTGRSGLVSYDTKTRNFVGVGGVDVAGARRAALFRCDYLDPDCDYLDPVHHINSLVSLKALGEESSKNKGRWTRKRKKIIEDSWTRSHKLIRNIIVKAKASAFKKNKKKIKRKTCKVLG